MYYRNDDCFSSHNNWDAHPSIYSIPDSRCYPSYSPSGIILDDGKSSGEASPARPHEPCLVLLVSNGQSQGIPSAQTGPASVTGRSGSSYHISEPKISGTRDPKENKRPDKISMKLQHYLQTMPSNSRATLAAINKA